MASKHPPVAVVGASALFPGSPEAERFWRNIVEGVDLFSEIPESHWRIADYYDPDPATPDKVYATRGGFLPDIDFAPMDFGIPPNVLPATDSAQLLALRVAKQVLEDFADGDFSHINRERVSVVLGSSGGTEMGGYVSGRLHRPVWERVLRTAGMSEPEVQMFSDRMSAAYTPWQENTFPGLLGNVIAGRIANRFDLGGTNCVIDAACASSLAALEVGLHELYLGEADMVLAGGVDAFNDIFMFMCFAKVTALSLSGDCRPFSDKSDGTMLGEGLSMLALKRLDDAERDGDRIYAVIRGIGTSSDGRAKSIYAPLPAGQAKALRRCYDAAGYGPETVGLVEAHGTGTNAGDAAEFTALNDVFNESGRVDRQWAALGSVKSQVGHTKGAAGACGLFKTVMALHHKTLPPTIKIDQPNPSLDIENSPFFLSTQAKPWVPDNGLPRRASVSSFGFGGTNFHVTVEEYTGTGKRARRYRSWDTELVVLGAPSAAALSEQAAALSTSLVDTDDMLGFIAHNTQSAYDASQPHRLALVVDGVATLRTMLDEAATKLQAPDVAASFSSPRGYFYSSQQAGPVALLFPGQGSQYVGMGSDIPQLHDAALAPWELARAELLNADRDLHKVVWPKTAFSDDERRQQSAELTKTEWAQPGIGAHSLSLLSVIRSLGITPAAVGGHSFGEVTALCAAGVFSEETALLIARARGALMAQAAATTDGAMCAVTAPLEEVSNRLAEWGIRVVVANHNAPDQVVLSGERATIQDAAQRFSAAGMNARMLDVATAFHSEIVSPAAVPFGEFLASIPFGAPALPVYANATAQPYAGDAAQLQATLANQIAQPVRFVEQIQAMYAAGARTFIEVGPGTVLTNLVGKCLTGQQHSAVSLDAKGRNGIRSLWLGLAQLVAAGVPMNLASLWADYRTCDDPRTRPQPKLIVKLNGTNLGKPEISDEPVQRPAAIAAVAATPTNHSGHLNGHKSESETKLAPSETFASVPHVNGTAPVAPSVPAPAFRTVMPAAPALAVPVAHNGNGSHAPATVAAPVPAAPALDISGDAVTQMLAAVGTLQDGINQLQSVLLGLAGRPAMAAVIAPPAASAAHTNGAATLPAPPAASVAPHTNGVSVKPVAPVAPVAPAPVAPVPAAAPALSPTNAGLVTRMLEVVAEKTGYPVEMLDLSMALEADLGIDSIKRVEILSAVQERIPSLPDVETATMAALVTLQEIVDYLQGRLGPAAPAAAPVAAPAAVAVPVPVAAAPAVSAVSADLMHQMLEVVAEKTGYPAEMLDLSMALEADLGIDSIKRVEILSAVQERIPSLPDVETATMAALVTLQEIVDYLQGLLGPTAPVAAPAPVAVPVPVAAAPAAPAVSADLMHQMLDVVAEKTGYPAEMLDLSMALEADLGIDSIKRVEILSAVQERIPGLPDVETATMAALVTLQEIVDYLQGLLGPAAPAAAPVPVVAAVATNGAATNGAVAHAVPVVSAPVSAPAAPVAPAASPAGANLVTQMLDVVAEKTGYPAEMLDLSMALEADLGIDSIKRVEILSAVQERNPGLPDVETSTMAALVTLQEIVDYLQGLLGPATPAAAPAPVAVPVATNGALATNGAVAHAAPVAAPAAPAASPAGASLVTQMLDVVAEKTGYPAEMLDLSMALEADLGIDSIKRVEILSAVQERNPGLPDVETSTMAALVTLQEIVDYLQSLMVSAGSHGAPTTSPPTVPASPNGAPVGDCVPFELAGASIARHAVRAIAAPASGMAMPGLYTAANVEIVAPAGDATAEALGAILRTHGIAAAIVTEPGATAEAVIHLGGLRPTASRADTLNLNRVVFADAQRVAAKFVEHGGVFVTVQDTGGTFGLLTEPGARAWAGGIAALAKTASQEWSTAQVKAIDIEVGLQSPITVAEYLAHELLAGGAELEVGLGSSHGRVTVVADAQPVTTHTRRIDYRDVIVVSGGARGVTAASVIALAQETQASFVLIGRTELGDEPAEARGLATDAELKRALLASAAAQGLKLTPKDLAQQVGRILADREVRGTLAALTAVGSRVRYAAADVRDAAQLGALLDSVRTEFGPITGLVHGAGVLADAPLHKKTLDGFDRVFETKVGGLCALLDATANDGLKVICLFSSVAARSGNVGQSDYAMANEILNKVALAEQARRGPACLVRALGWGPWDSGMVTPGLKAMFESRGISLIPLEEGARAFVSDLLDAHADSPEVTLGDGVMAGSMPDDGRVARVLAHVTRQPYLLDHRVHGKVVLAMVQVLEWFVRMVEACRPGQHVDRVLDLRVLRGVTLNEFENQGDPMLVRCAPVEGEPDRLACTLADITGPGSFYSATVEIGSGTTIPADLPNFSTAPQHGRQLDHDACYSSEALFHGPAFQVLENVVCQESSASAALHGLLTAGWPGEGWATDAAALDGCLQLALVWSFEQLGRKVLPLRVGEVIRHRAGALGDGLRCVLSNGDAKSNRAVCDLDLVGADNLPIASLKRLELYPYGD